MANVAIDRVNDNVFLISGTAVNWTILREGQALTLVDSGYPGDAHTVIESIAQIGHRVEDVAAVLVTHGHVDHIGGLTNILHRHHTPVYAHPLEMDLLQGIVHEQAGPWDLAARIWRPTFARWTLQAVRAGASHHPVISSAQAFPSDGALDLPGHPVPVHCGGHTTGHTAYHLPNQSILLSGDSLVTGHPVTRSAGPQLLPGFFAHDPRQTFATLSALAGLPADTIVPGHGPTWRGNVREAVETARAHAPRDYRRRDSTPEQPSAARATLTRQFARAPGPPAPLCGRI